MSLIFLAFLSFSLVGFSQCTEVEHKSTSFERNGKLFPFIITIIPGTCTAASGDMGTCFTSFECMKRGGQSSGTCAKGFGVCCVFTATCGGIVTQNVTYFQNANYPSSTMGGGDCAVTVRRQPNICQIRLDFLDFNLPKPDVNGVCQDARFIVMDNSNSQTKLPELCGQFRNEHMYADFGGSDYITLNYMGIGPKSWRTRIQMIECTSLLKAPDGCLQYYYDNGGMGRVEILGYNPSQPPHLANLTYTLCVRREVGRDSITWRVCDQKSFSMSGDTTISAIAFQDQNCMKDYIQMLGRGEYPVPGETIPGNSDSVFCGTALTRLPAMPNTPSKNEAITTSAKPFVIHVETDDMEDPAFDIENVGFCLTYRQA